MELRDAPGGKGRGMFATREFAPGALVLRSRLACASIHRKHASRLCALCLVYSDTPMLFSCPGCCLQQQQQPSTFYCSQKCMNDDRDVHGAHCHLLAQVDALPKEEALMVRLLMRLVDRDMVEEMMVDNKSIPGFHRRRAQRKRAASAYIQLTQQHHLSAAELERVLSRGPPNDFAAFDDSDDGEPAGSLWFPRAALLNHTCVPATSVQLEGPTLAFYATRRIEVGEEITQCYTNVMADTEARRAEIAEAWGFQCQCARCRGECCAEFDALNLCHCGGVSVPEAKRGNHSRDNCWCNSYNFIGV